MATRIINIRSGAPYDSYIGRAVPRRGLACSKWSNPYRIGKHGDRANVLRLYREYLLSSRRLLRDIHELHGKVLACWCAPETCHGDVLAEIVNLVTDDLVSEICACGDKRESHPSDGACRVCAWNRVPGIPPCQKFRLCWKETQTDELLKRLSIHTARLTSCGSCSTVYNDLSGCDPCPECSAPYHQQVFSSETR